MVSDSPQSPRYLLLFRFLVMFVVLAASTAHTTAQVGGLDAPQAVAPYFNGIFPAEPPGQAAGWTTTLAFPNLTFSRAIWMTEIPGTNELLLVTHNGRIWRFPNNPNVTQSQVVDVLNWSAKTQTSIGDQGFFHLVFHPQFGQPGSPNANYAYVCYSFKYSTLANEERSYWRISRFTWQPATGTLDPNSEFVLINQYDPQSWHQGGAMFFGNDGFLYFSSGDPGGNNDPNNGTQRLDYGFFSGIFRIDVDNDPAKSHAIRRQPVSAADKPTAWPASSTQGYGIPNDNPWLATNGSILEEYYAQGFRSPHSAHYDAATGEIWVGDVGQNTREELDRVTKGTNAQWAYREGTIAGPKTKPATVIGTELPPVHDYSHSNVGSCIISGMRYRGTKWDATLGGKVIFGDHTRGKIWTATLGAPGVPPVITEIIGDLPVGGTSTGQGLTNFCMDSAGEIYCLDLNGQNLQGGAIRKLVAAGVSSEPPQYLSQTGIFTNLATLATVPGVIPYDVANPLWSDNAAKRRWIIVPNNGTHDTAAEDIVFNENGNWKFPPGTVFVKHFEVPIDERNPSVTRRLETRFIICTADGGKYGVTYRWNLTGTDAQLLTTGEGLDYDVTLQDGNISARHWDFPSRSDCMFCHTTVAGQALGLRTHQLNMSITYPSTGRTANQLTTFNALGMFDRTLTVAELENFLESRSLSDSTAPLEHRVRSYLDSNCSHCHQLNSAFGFFDTRLSTPLDRQGLVNGVLQGTFDMGPDARYIKPGSPELSALHARLAAVGTGAAMPPLAKNVADAQAIAKLQEYIASLNPTELQLTTSPQARYVRLTGLNESIGRKTASVPEFSVLDGTGYPIPRSVQSIYSVDSEELQDEYAPASYAIDGNLSTYWHTAWGAKEPNYPHQITIDLGSIRSIGGFIYYPQTDPSSGRIKNYQVHYSTNASNWTLMTSGTWTNYTDPFRYDGLVGLRQVRCQIAGPSGFVAGTPSFNITIAFDKEVTGFIASDLQISGGTVTKLRGKGYYYVATIAPTTASVIISVKPSIATDSRNNVNRASNSLTIPQRTLFQQWAFDHGVDDSPASQLADEDHDGISKFMEYAFNLDPAHPDAGLFDPVTSPDKGLPRLTIDDSQGTPRLTLQYLQRKNGQGINYAPQFGSMLIDFTNATGAPTIESINSNWERVTITDQATGQPMRFGRVRVATP